MADHYSVKVPILIGQQQRCGGSLLSKSLGAHPSIFAHPHEGYWGRPYKYHWLVVDPTADVQEIWNAIAEPTMEVISTTGKVIGKGDHPIRYDYDKHRLLFLSRIRATSDRRPGSIFMAYLDCLYEAIEHGQQAVIPTHYAFFVPRMALYTEHYLADLPNGHVIQTIRHPLAYFNSVRLHNRFYDRESAKFLWMLFALHAIASSARYNNFHPVVFEELLREPTDTLATLCMDIGINFSDDLLNPSCLGFAWRGDSHFKKTSGIDLSVADHYKKYLNEGDERYFAREICLYERMIKVGGRGIAGLSDAVDPTLMAAYRQYLALYLQARPVNTKGYIKGAYELYQHILGEEQCASADFYDFVASSEENVLRQCGELVGEHRETFCTTRPPETTILDLQRLTAEQTALLLSALYLQAGREGRRKYIESTLRGGGQRFDRTRFLTACAVMFVRDGRCLRAGFLKELVCQFSRLYGLGAMLLLLGLVGKEYVHRLTVKPQWQANAIYLGKLLLLVLYSIGYHILFGLKTKKLPWSGRA